MTPSALAQTTENPIDVIAWANGDDNVSADNSDPSVAPGGAAPTGTVTGGGSGGEMAGSTVH
jgi:hypothetical protein